VRRPFFFHHPMCESIQNSSYCYKWNQQAGFRDQNYAYALKQTPPPPTPCDTCINRDTKLYMRASERAWNNRTNCSALQSQSARFARFRVSAAMWLWSLLFRAFMQRRLVVGYRGYATTPVSPL
jgi:hypothetical protein